MSTNGDQWNEKTFAGKTRPSPINEVERSEGKPRVLSRGRRSTGRTWIHALAPDRWIQKNRTRRGVRSERGSRLVFARKVRVYRAESYLKYLLRQTHSEKTARKSVHQKSIVKVTVPERGTYRPQYKHVLIRTSGLKKESKKL